MVFYSSGVKEKYNEIKISFSGYEEKRRRKIKNEIVYRVLLFQLGPLPRKYFRTDNNKFRRCAK